MIVAAALSFAAACCAVAIVSTIRSWSDRKDRLTALDALQRAEAVNASLRTRLSRKPGVRAQAEKAHIAVHTQLADEVERGVVAPLAEKAA